MIWSHLDIHTPIAIAVVIVIVIVTVIIMIIIIMIVIVLIMNESDRLHVRTSAVNRDACSNLPSQKVKRFSVWRKLGLRLNGAANLSNEAPDEKAILKSRNRTHDK